MGPFSEVIIGATQVDGTVAFLELFDFVVVEEVGIDDHFARDVLGLDGVPEGAVRMGSRSRPDSATLLIVATPHAGRAAVDWEPGPRALDVYTVDLDATLAIATAAGFAVSPVGRLAAGPMTMRQSLVSGPGALSVVFVETTHRRSSVLDLEHHGDHSEPHSVVWVVADHPAEVTWWTTGGWTSAGQWNEGFTAGNTISFTEPSIGDELGLPQRSTPITMTMLSDPTVEPIRLELMTFDDHLESASPAGVDSARSLLRSGLFAMVVEGAGGDACRLITSPGGVRMVLRP